MPAILLALLILMLIGCASKQPPTEHVAECLSDEFSGSGTGANENEALAEAHSALSRQISSSVNVTIERVVSQQISNGKENLNSGYESKTVIESALPNAHDARIVRSKRNGNKINVTVCMSKADAAKGFLERQRLLVDSLGLVSNIALNTEHPKQKNEAWRKTQILYNDFMRVQHLLEGWEIRSPYLADEIYSKTREDYKNYCGAAKLHWNPERENPYSEIAFSKLSSGIKIEKSPCVGRGISLAYKNTGDKCEHAGVFKCSHQPSLLIASCEYAEYRLLEYQNVETFNKREETAKEMLQEKLRNEIFWNKWEQGIKQWSPQCE